MTVKRVNDEGVLLSYNGGDAPLPPPEQSAPADALKNDAELIANLSRRLLEAEARVRQFAPADSEAKLFKLHTLEEFIQRPTVSTYVRGLVPSKSIVVVFGPPKGGKTYSVCDLTMHAAHGLDWHGCKIARPLKVAYMVGEGASGFRVRLRAWREYHDNLATPGLFRIMDEALSLPAQASAVIETLREFSPDIVVTDTLNAYFGGGDENSTQDMSGFCHALRYVRDELGCSIVVIHHTGHGDSGRERGSIVLRATADVLIQVAKDETAGKLVGFQVIAARDLAPMESPIALRLSRHETEWVDDDGQPMAACIVHGADESVTLPGRGGKPLGEVQTIVLEAARDLARAVARPQDGEVLLARLDVAKLAKERGVASASAISNCWARLESRGYFRRVEPGSIAIRALP